MRSLAFLLTRRWILFLITVLMLAWGAWWLGEWQFHRLDERKDRNSILERNIDAEPLPVDRVFTVDHGLPTENQWQRVTAVGEYDVANTVVVRYRTRDGASGIDVVVPLITTDGTALMVDRGWLATENSGTRPEQVPAPPTGEVTVTGWARQDATGDSARVSDHSTRAISSTRIAEATGLTAYQGFIDVTEEQPGPATELVRAEPPDRTNGPHFFYGLQWWFFGVLAIVGFGWMAVDEYRGRTGKRPARKPRQPRPRPPRTTAAERLAARQATLGTAAQRSQGPQGSPVDRDDRAADE